MFNYFDDTLINQINKPIKSTVKKRKSCGWAWQLTPEIPALEWQQDQSLFWDSLIYTMSSRPGWLACLDKNNKKKEGLNSSLVWSPNETDQRPDM